MLKKNLKINIHGCLCIIIGIVVALGAFAIMPKVFDQLPFFWQEAECNANVDDKTELTGGSNVFVQQFSPSFSNTKQIKILVETNGKYKSGALDIRLIDTENGKEIDSIERDTLYVENEEEFTLVVPSGELLEKEHVYEIEITCHSTGEENKLYVQTSSATDMGSATLNGIELDAGLHFVQVGYNRQVLNTTPLLALLIFISIAIVCMIVLAYKNPGLESINKIDWVFLAIAMLSCSLIFYQGWDMDITVEHAMDLMRVIKNDNIFHYYDTVILKSHTGQYNLLSSGFAPGMVPNMCVAAYNIWMYIILAVLIIPFVVVTRLFHISYVCTDIAIYVSIILSGVVLFSAYLMYKIAIMMNMEKTRAKLMAYIYASSSIILFGTIGFLQLDIIYICIMQVAYIAYLKKRYIPFSIIMSFAIMLKVLPIMVFIPLILLVEKRIPHIIKHGVIGMFLTVLDSMIFKNSFGYMYISSIKSSLLNFKDRIFATGMNSGVSFVAFFIVAYVIICLWCFDRDLKDEEQWKSIVVIPLLVYTAFALLIAWHPQWFILLAPSIVMVVCMNLGKRSLFYCELGIGVLYCIQSAVSFPGSVDNYMVNNGIYKLITDHTYTGIQLIQVLNNLTDGKAIIIVYSLLFSLIIYFCIVGTREVMKRKTISNGENKNLSRGLVYSRIIWMYLFCTLYAMMYFYLG